MLEAEARGGRAADPILIVEGADLLRRILIQDVEEMGYRVEAVASGAAALAALESWTPRSPNRMPVDSAGGPRPATRPRASSS